ncbi:MAG: dockerin type I repeat-containing protein [Ruminococcus sp.]|nr:dockerin type I repeat-containing protein [Ruminococcus sp.]
MKRFKRGFALILGAAMAMSAVTALSVDARTNYIDEPFVLPAGFEEYEVFDDAGLLSWINNSTHSEKHAYIPYWFDDGINVRYLCFTNFHYNNVEVTTNNKELWQEIYQKYGEELDFDYVTDFYTQNADGTYTGYLYDDCDENGYEFADPAKAEDKSALIQEMCAEMYEAGCVTEATYTPYTAIYAVGWESPVINVWNLGETGDSEVGKLQEILSQFRADGTVKYDETTECYSLVIDSLQAPDLMYAIKEVYPDAIGNMGTFQMTSSKVSAEAVDLLAALEQEENVPGDVNADGTTDITDAVLILQHYAESAASGAAAASETNMDVNRDGSITIDDATEVLGIYAQNAAGVTES